MSLLMAFHQDEAAMLLTDTVAADTEGTWSHFVTKCFVIPHLNMVIAATGIDNIAARWADVVHSQMLCRDIEMAAIHAPGALRQIQSQVEAEFGDILHGVTTTIYHYGRAERSGWYVAYAFRSTNDYEAEVLEPGFRVKPQPNEALSTYPCDAPEWIALARKIRSEQDAKPQGAVQIGGELVLTTLIDGMITTRVVHRFHDYEPQWLAMHERARGSA
jgi:hypothetical protein